MTVERILERVIAIEGRVQIDDLRRGTLDDIARANAGAVAVRLRDSLPVIERLPRGGVPGLIEFLDDIPTGDFIVVDSLPALVLGAGSRDEEMASAVHQLKAAAVERRKVILLTAPLPDLEMRPDRRPVLDDFGVLGAVKQHADVVLALFREDLYEPSRDITGATELIVRKNRNGAIGYADLYFYAQWMRFEDMLDPDK
jgi:replicative DNA helicase